MIKIKNQSNFVPSDPDNYRLTWYEPEPVDGMPGLYFVGTVKPLSPEAYSRMPTREIVIYEKSTSFADEYDAVWYESFLKFALQGGAIADDEPDDSKEGDV